MAYTENNDYPQLIENYENDRYPQIPCLVEDVRFFGIRYWNVNEEYWDDEEADNFFYSKEKIVRWRYLDYLLDEK